MNLKCQHVVWFSIVVLVVVGGCSGIAPVITPIAMSTETRTPSPISNTVTSTPDDVATANFIETASIGTIVSTVEPYTLEQYPSLDGKWNVEIIRYECVNYSYEDYIGIIAYEQLRLINLNEGGAKVVDDQGQACDGIGTFGLDGLYWSSSNRYFYYTDSREGYPGGCGNYLALPIYRLDTETMEVIKLDGGFLSPDQQKLAMWHGHEIVIWDLDKGEIGRVTPSRTKLFNGRMWWSQKSDSVLFLQTEFQCAPNYGKSQITSLDLKNYSQTLFDSFESLDMITASAPPVGEFVLSSYPPLVMNYDSTIWQDESLYAAGDSTLNYLQAKELLTCHLRVHRSVKFETPYSTEIKRIGKFNFTLVTLDEEPPSDFTHMFYLADQFITDYDLSNGAPVIEVGAVSSEWDRCKVSAEEVLATLQPSLK